MAAESTRASRANPSGSPRLSRARRTAILKAMSDPTRFDLLERIAKASCPLSCSAAGSELAVSPATLSHHLKELETAGLIRVRREGKFGYLSLRPGVLEALMDTLGRLRPAQCDQPLPKVE